MLMLLIKLFAFNILCHLDLVQIFLLSRLSNNMPLILWLIIIAECGIWNHHMLFGSFRSLNDHESLKSPNDVVDDIKKWARKLDPEKEKQLATKLDELSTVLSNGDDFISFIHSFDELFASSVAIILLFLGKLYFIYQFPYVKRYSSDSWRLHTSFGHNSCTMVQ